MSKYAAIVREGGERVRILSQLSQADRARVQGDFSSMTAVVLDDKRVVLAANTPKTVERFEKVVGGNPAPR